MKVGGKLRGISLAKVLKKEPLSQSKGIKKLLMQMSKSDPSPE
jgi:hypothetical protein